MKLNDITGGRRYFAKVSGQLLTVRVFQLDEVSARASGRWKTVTYAVNEATRRRITIRLPYQLRQRLEG